MLVHIAQEGVTTTDLFRRPGNPTDLKYIMKRLTEGREIQFSNYNFYTLASVIKVQYALLPLFSTFLLVLCEKVLKYY